MVLVLVCQASLRHPQASFTLPTGLFCATRRPLLRSSQAFLRSTQASVTFNLTPYATHLKP